MNNISRRFFMQLLGGAALAATAEAQTAPPTEIPADVEQQFKSLKMDALDKEILRGIIKSGVRVENQLDGFYNCLKHPDWKVLEPRWKTKIIEELAADRAVFSRKEENVPLSVDMSDFRLVISPKSPIFAETTVIKRELTYNWLERPERKTDYISLSPMTQRKLSPETRDWARRLLFAVNDNLHTLIATPDSLPSAQELRKGQLNGKLLCTVAGTFPKRSGDFNEKISRERWELSEPGLDAILEARGIPQDIREIYHEIGYVSILSDLEGGGGVGSYTSSRCNNTLIGKIAVHRFMGQGMIMFSHCTTEEPPYYQEYTKLFREMQERERKWIWNNFQLTIKDVAETKGLPPEKQAVLKEVMAQLKTSPEKIASRNQAPAHRFAQTQRAPARLKEDQ